jgi:hypothetical protein
MARYGIRKYVLLIIGGTSLGQVLMKEFLQEMEECWEGLIVSPFRGKRI